MPSVEATWQAMDARNDRRLALVEYSHEAKTSIAAIDDAMKMIDHYRFLSSAGRSLVRRYDKKIILASSPYPRHDIWSASQLFAIASASHA